MSSELDTLEFLYKLNPSLNNNVEIGDDIKTKIGKQH